ncbi:MAG: pyruvate kinase, partial [Candidatus Promineifilaceae bacterium]
IAKVEKAEAIECLDEIIAEADGVMVARGDLGLDMPPFDVPFLQKEIIRKCNQAGKPVITATQMLQSMTDTPVPTRAEATDVANAILDGTDAVMLSSETAVGLYPVQAVEMMRKIALRTEEAFPFSDWFERRRTKVQTSIENTGDSISSASCAVATQINADAIVTTTVSGYTARQVARWRPRQRIIALTPNMKTMQRMALVWGVESVQVMRFGQIDEMIDDIRDPLLEAGFAIGDRVVITAGVPFGKAGLTNMLQVYEFAETD